MADSAACTAPGGWIHDGVPSGDACPHCGADALAVIEPRIDEAVAQVDYWRGERERLLVIRAELLKAGRA